LTRNLSLQHTSMPRVYAMFGFVRRNASLFTDPYTRLALYFAFVRSKLEYASLIWNPFTTTHRNRIERLQKQFLKFALLPLRFLDPTPSYHQQCRLVHLPSLEHRRSILAICFISDLVDGSIDCPELLSKVGFHAPSRQLRNFDPFFLELRRTKIPKMSPSIGPYMSLTHSQLICNWTTSQVSQFLSIG